MKKKKALFVISVALLFTIIILFYQSYAIFEINTIEKGNITIKVGTMEPTIKVDGVDTNDLTIAAGETKTFKVTLENLNNVAGQFILYYIDSPSTVAFGYLDGAGVDVPPDGSQGEIIESNGKRTYLIKMTNYNTTPKTLYLSVDSGLSTGGKSMHPMGNNIPKYEELNLADIIVRKSSTNDSESQYVNHDATSQQTDWKILERREYRYMEDNPNNYVYFNCSNPYDTSTCEVWRIIGSFTVDNGNGVKERRAKLIRSSGALTTSYPYTLDNDFYNRTGDYATTGLTASARAMVGNAKYYTASIGSNRSALDLFNAERGTVTISGGDYDSATTISEIRKIGLAYPSDYAYTYKNGTTCYNDLDDCNTSSWISSTILSGAWLLNPSSFTKEQVNGLNKVWHYYLYIGGPMHYATIEAKQNTNHLVTPVLYLNADIKAISGTGTSTDPYVLKPVPNSNITNIYAYNQETGSDTFCVTGEESTCVQIEAPATYEAGTIIKYKVNDTEEKYFHVISDNGTTLTLQQRENTINLVAWYAGSNNNANGPTTILPALESATSMWSNVIDQTYTLGTTVLKTNKYTGCTATSCTKNAYTLSSRTAKARLITMQEAIGLGCTTTQKSCPVWMYNYLYNSTGFGGTVNQGTSQNTGYWTISADSSRTTSVWNINFTGLVNSYNTSSIEGGRAVIMINK